MRKLSPRGMALIMHFEGGSPKEYRCPAGYRTIGYGHMIKAGEDFSEPLTQEQMEELLARDVGAACGAVTRLLPVPLTDNQFASLVSFAFNFGAAALQRSTLRQKILRGEHAHVPREFRKWIWAKGRKLPGLIRRRHAEAQLYQLVN